MVGKAMSLALLLEDPAPVLALAPMQDISDLSFWRLISGYGGADHWRDDVHRDQDANGSRCAAGRESGAGSCGGLDRA